MPATPPLTAEAIRAAIDAAIKGLPQLQPVYDTSPQLAQQIFNPGNRGQNARYDVSKLTRGPDGRLTDGTYHYAENGLSLDRPDSVVPGLPGADNLNDWSPGAPTPWVTPQGPRITGWQLPTNLPQGYNPDLVPRPLAPGQQATEDDMNRAKAWIASIVQSQVAKGSAPRVEWTGGRPLGVSQTAVRPVSVVPKKPVFPQVKPPPAQNPYGSLGPSPQRIAAVEKNYARPQQAKVPAISKPVPKLQQPPKGTPVPKIAPPPKKPKPGKRSGV